MACCEIWTRINISTFSRMYVEQILGSWSPEKYGIWENTRCAEIWKAHQTSFGAFHYVFCLLYIPSKFSSASLLFTFWLIACLPMCREQMFWVFKKKTKKSFKNLLYSIHNLSKIWINLLNCHLPLSICSVDLMNNLKHRYDITDMIRQQYINEWIWDKRISAVYV